MKSNKKRKSLKFSITSIIFAFFLLFVMAGSNGVKNHLNRLFFDNVISEYYRQIETILPNYFNYLQNTAFWIEAGDFPDLSESKASRSLLKHGVLLTLPGVAAVNYRKGETVDIFTLNKNQVVLTEKKYKKNYRQRYLVELKNISENASSYYEKIYITDIYNLETVGEQGYSIIIDLKSTPPISVSLDISLSGFADFYQNMFSSSAVFFSYLNKNELVTFPLNRTALNNLPNDSEQKSNTDFSYYKEMINTVLMKFEDNQDKRSHYIKYDNKFWLVVPFRLNNYGGTIGFIIPESELFFSQYNSLYIITSIPFFLMFIFITSFYFISRYREKTKWTEEEKILHLIEKGESKKLEFKSSLRWDYRENRINKNLEDVIMKTIAAFGNAYGGTLLIGVDDDGAVLGLINDYGTLKHPDKDGFEQHLRNIISAMYGTFSIKNIDIDFISVKDKEICRISVSKSPSPIFTITKNTSGNTVEQFYIRDGNLSRRIESLNEILKYCSKRFEKK